jgi:DNA polymerase
MRAEMPKHYWKNLPEAELIPTLVREASERVETMIARSEKKVVRDEEYGVAAPPAGANLAKLRAAARKCTACPLYRIGTQTVFGEGPEDARVVFLGEQPGDQEDREGRPFIGPAGQMLDRALQEAGIDRDTCYVTNTVKHFKWESRGKRRIHAKPGAREIAACRPWAEAELARIQPQLLVCLGATAAQFVFGSGARIERDRGKIVESPYTKCTLVTVHPSSLLRQPDAESREREYGRFVADLRVAAKALK